MRIERRHSETADFVALMGEPPSQTVRAWTWVCDGDPVAIAGWYMSGTRAVVFSNLVDRGISKVRIWREALGFMRDMDLPALCVATCGSEAFLERLGWRHAYSGPYGEVYQCNL